MLPSFGPPVPTVTGRFYPNPAKSLEREMFAAFINPTPLLDIAAQELASRAQGVVIVYIEAERDTYALRNVLKVCRRWRVGREGVRVGGLKGREGGEE